MKIFKKIIKIFFILIIILLSAIIATPFLFKDKIIELAKQEINKQVNAQIDFGEFSLSVFSNFPNVSFRINDVKVIGIEDFENDTLLNLKEFKTVIDIMSLLGDEIKIREIALINPNISVKVLKNGKANWDITKESESDESEKSEEISEDPTAFKLNLKKFEIINANIKYNDLESDMSSDIKNLQFILSGDLASDKTNLNIITIIEYLTFTSEGIDLLKKANVNFSADLIADLINSIYTFNDNSLKINELELKFDGNISMPDDDIGLDMTFSSPKSEFKHILSMVPAVYMTDFAGLETSGNFELSGKINGIYNDSLMPGFDIKLLINNGFLKYPDLPTSVKNILVDLHVFNPDGNEDNTVINIAKFHCNMGGNPIDMKLLVKTPVSDPAIEGWFKGRVNLSEIQTFYPLEDMTLSGIINSDVEFNGKMSQIEQERYEDFKAVGQISCSKINYISGSDHIIIDTAFMEVSPKYFDLKAMNAKMFDSDFNMSGKIENFMGYAFRDELLKGNFSFKSNYMNLNTLLADDPNTTTQQTQTEALSNEEELTAFEVPKNIDFVLNSSINKLIYDNLEITSLQGEIQIKEGKASMKDVNMHLLDGIMKMDGYYSYTGDKPEVNFDMTIQNFDINKTFDAFNTVQKIAPIAEKCSGSFGLKLSFNSFLEENMDPILSSLNGTGSMLTRKVKVSDISVLDKLSEILKVNNFKTLLLDNVNIKFNIVDGNIEIEPFTTKIEKSELTFGGKQGVDQSLNYILNMRIPSSELGSAANTLMSNLSSQAGQAGLNIKVPEIIDVNGTITGTVSNPILKLDLKQQATSVIENIKDQVIQKVTEEIDKAKEEAIRRAREQADKLMQEAEIRSQQIMAAAEKSAQEINNAAKIAADKVRSEGDTQARNVINAAKGKGPIADAAAKKSAEQIRSEANQKARDIENKAAAESAAAVNKARSETEAIKRNAKQEGDRIIAAAERG